MYAINPAMVILLVPIISAYSRGIHPFKLIVRGSFVTAASPFLLVLGANYFTAIMFVVVLSAGEVIYSPPVYEYNMMLAPQGREGLYTSMASAPMFVAKLFVGGLSGYLLQNYCPEVCGARLTGLTEAHLAWRPAGAAKGVQHHVAHHWLHQCCFARSHVRAAAGHPAGGDSDPDAV